MTRVVFLLSLCILLNSPDCDPQKQDERIRSLEADVKQLKAEIVELKQTPKPERPEHHYELRSEGMRTWRFDSSTGETCVQLTSDADWKRKETKGQSCACSDNSDHWLQMPQMPTDTDAQKTAAANYYSFMVKPSCGII
jgi:hypothetical protein